MNATYLSPLPLIAAALAIGCSLPELPEETSGSSDAMTTESEPDTTTDDAETDAPTTGETDDGSTGDDEDTGSSDTGEPDDGEFACGQGRLFIGNPLGDVALRPADGDPAIDQTDGGPSLPSRRVLASPADPSKVVVTMGSELWYLDASDGTLNHILGDFDGGVYRAGPCASADIGIASDMAFRPDGTLYLAEHSGNGIAEVVDPFGAGCTMNYYAGTQEEVNINPLPAEPGNVDGPAADARFAGPDWIAADGEDLYILDDGNRSIRKIDSSHTVSTVAMIPGDYSSANGIAVVGGKIYLPARGSVEGTQNATILELDPESGESREVATGRDDPWLVGSSGPDMAHIVALGGNRIATWVNGRIFSVDVSTGDVEHIAGDGESLWQLADFGPDYDPFAEHDAMQLELDTHTASTAGASAFLSYWDGGLYFSGLAEGYLVYQIDCE